MSDNVWDMACLVSVAVFLVVALAPLFVRGWPE
jgi:hypothetical protein